MKKKRRKEKIKRIKVIKWFDNDCAIIPYIAFGSNPTENISYLHIGWCWSVATIVIKRKKNKKEGD